MKKKSGILVTSINRSDKSCYNRNI